MISWAADKLSHDERLHHERFAKNYELSSILSSQVDGEHILVGVSEFQHVLCVQPTVERKELGHILINCRTRGGKGLLGNSQILSWPQSLIINDIKGEYYEQTARWRQRLGPVFVIDPTGFGNTYDPFVGKAAEDDLKTAATNILFRPDEGENAIFTSRAVTMLTQLMLAARLEEQAILPYVRHLIFIGPVDTAKRLHLLSVQRHRYPNLATRFLDMSLGDMLKKHFDDRFFQSAWSTLTHRIDPLLSDRVIRCLNGSDFTAADIIQGEQPVTVYLRWPERSLLTLAPFIRLVWCSLIEEMMYLYDSATDKKTCRRVLAMLDEAGRTAVPMISEYVTTAAGRGISFWIAVQSPSQLEAIYGQARAEVIRDNTELQIFYRPPNFKTARELRDWLGDETGYAVSTTIREGAETSQARSERPMALLSPQEIRRLKNEEIIAFYADLPPIRAHRMDFRRFAFLKARLNLPPPPLPPLPAVAARMPELSPSPPLSVPVEQSEFVNPEQFIG